MRFKINNFNAFIVYQGDGTRRGNGICICKDGYNGETCNTCVPSYFAISVKNAAVVNCKGLIYEPLSISVLPSTYLKHVFNRLQIICKLTIFYIAACDISCMDGCTKSGPGGCNNCTNGWTMQAGFCIGILFICFMFFYCCKKSTHVKSKQRKLHKSWTFFNKIIFLSSSSFH